MVEQLTDLFRGKLIHLNIVNYLFFLSGQTWTFTTPFLKTLSQSLTNQRKKRRLLLKNISSNKVFFFFFVVFVFHIRHTLGSAKLELRSKFVLLPVPWRGGATLVRGRKGKKTFSEFDCDNLLRLAAGCQRRPLVSATQTRLEGDRGGLTAVEVGGGRGEV